MRTRFFLCAMLALAACSSPSPQVYRKEAFDPSSPFEQRFATTPEVACEAGRRALLSQGYLIDSEEAMKVQATKAFQPVSDQQVKLVLSIFCVPSGGEGDRAAIFANGRELRYVLKASAANAGLTVSGIGSISLPWNTTNDSLVKVGEQTVTDPEFYRRFFALIDTFMP